MPFISASAISPYNSIRGGAAGPAGTLLLDLYPGAVAAYSVRKLSSAYTGDAIRVRVDTTGQPTYDIGFDANGDLDTVDLLSKAGSNSVYVDIWYDQSGEGINATQTSASKQPVIVSNGVVNELNGEPAMNFLSPFLMDLNLSQYPFTSGGSATEKSIFAVAENDSTANQNLYNIADTRDIYALTYNRSANNTYGFFGANYGSIGGNITGQNIISSIAISPSSKTFNNSVEGVSSNLVRANFNDISIGSRGGSYAMDGNIQELVMYESNQLSNRAGIESNINSHYNVFWNGSQTGILDDYPGSTAAYSLRALNSAYTGPAIRVTTTGSDFKDIGLLYDGSLDTDSLLSFAGSGNATVQTWYDQSGEGNNAVQGTLSRQPNIVESGVLVTMLDEPAMDTTSQPNSGFINSSPSNLKPANSSSSIFVLGRDSGTAASTRHLLAYSNVDIRFAYLAGSNVRLRSQIWNSNGTGLTTEVSASNNIPFIGTSIRGQSYQTVFNNGVQGQNKTGLPTPSANTTGTLSLFSLTNNFSFEGFYSELIFYPSDQLENRAGIESNINSNYNIYWDGSQTGLLDDYPNAAAAYSLRALSSNYTGYAIRVRRPSDNDVKDIGLLYDGSLDTESLLSFADGGDVFVTIRYDQSGNGNDLTNISAVNQPKIVSSGQIITENQKPMIDYDGANHYLKTSSGLDFGTSARSLFLVQKTDVVGYAVGRFTIAFSSEIGGSWGVTPEIYVRGTGRVWAGQVSTPTISTSLISNIYTSGDLVAGNSMWLDGSSITQSGSTDGSINTSNDPMIEGARGEGTFLFDGKVGDTIVYKSDQSTNRAGIESNINSYYNMYWDGSQTGLLDDYPDAAAAYSLRALSSEYTGAAIKVRKVVAGVTFFQDIGFLYDGSLDTESLLSFAGPQDVFVATWYDQSGEGNDAVQGVVSWQPKIVSSGVVITENGKPSVEFDGFTDYIKNQLSVEPTVTAFAVSKIVDESDYNFIYDSFGTGARLRLGLWTTNGYFADNGDGANAVATTASDGSQHLFFAKHSNSEVSISVDQDTLQTVESTNFSQTTQYWNIGARNDGGEHFLEGTIQELIIYPSDESENRTDIETNINEYYNVY